MQSIDPELVGSIIKPRKKYTHKGDYGHAALVAGSVGMMGAAVLSAGAALRSGVGKLTCHIASIGYHIMQISVPEAMCKIEAGDDHTRTLTGLDKYDAVGIGPGLGSYDSNVSLLTQAFEQNRKPMVIDADALNTIAKHPSLYSKIPPGSIFTPHMMEFERLFGKTADDHTRKELAIEKAMAHQILIVLKGAESFIATPGGMGYTNTTGNPGMATGGTGDVLTGILTGLLAQGYPPEQAAIAAVFLHGLAGDLAASRISQPSLIASDLIEYLGDAFLNL